MGPVAFAQQEQQHVPPAVAWWIPLVPEGFNDFTTPPTSPQSLPSPPALEAHHGSPEGPVRPEGQVARRLTFEGGTRAGFAQLEGGVLAGPIPVAGPAGDAQGAVSGNNRGARLRQRAQPLDLAWPGGSTRTTRTSRAAAAAEAARAGPAAQAAGAGQGCGKGAQADAAEAGPLSPVAISSEEDWQSAEDSSP